MEGGRRGVGVHDRQRLGRIRRSEREFGIRSDRPLASDPVDRGGRPGDRHRPVAHRDQFEVPSCHPRRLGREQRESVYREYGQCGECGECGPARESVVAHRNPCRRFRRCVDGLDVIQATVPAREQRLSGAGRLATGFLNRPVCASAAVHGTFEEGHRTRRRRLLLIESHRLVPLVASGSTSGLLGVDSAGVAPGRWAGKSGPGHPLQPSAIAAWCAPLSAGRPPRKRLSQ